MLHTATRTRNGAPESAWTVIEIGAYDKLVIASRRLAQLYPSRYEFRVVRQGRSCQLHVRHVSA